MKSNKLVFYPVWDPKAVVISCCYTYLASVLFHFHNITVPFRRTSNQDETLMCHCWQYLHILQTLYHQKWKYYRQQHISGFVSTSADKTDFTSKPSITIPRPFPPARPSAISPSREHPILLPANHHAIHWHSAVITRTCTSGGVSFGHVVSSLRYVIHAMVYAREWSTHWGGGWMSFGTARQSSRKETVRRPVVTYFTVQGRTIDFQREIVST